MFTSVSKMMPASGFRFNFFITYFLAVTPLLHVTGQNVSVNCGYPGILQNGRLIGSSYVLGDVIIFVCNEYYVLRGAISVTCQANGTWSRPIPRCELIQCTQPNLTNGEVLGGPIWLPSQWAYFVCNQGFKLKGLGRISCNRVTNELAEWSTRWPVCEAITCSQILNPINGRVLGNDVTYGSKAYFVCNSGYVLSGSESSKCTDTGWSNLTPTCQACPSDTYLNSEGKCSPCPANSRAIISAGFSAKHCVCDNAYTGPPGGPCAAIRCVLPEVSQNSTLISCGLRPGDKCDVTCDPGFVLTGGARTRTCRSDGSWDCSGPVCSPCPIHTYQANDYTCLSCPENSYTISEGSVFDNCTCREGYARNATGLCVDVDECSRDVSPCDDVCINTIGGYVCSCNTPGYVVDPQNKDKCAMNRTCRNLTSSDSPNNGGLVCHYYKEGNSYQCRVMCNDYYDFSREMVDEYHYCGPQTNFSWESASSRLSDVARVCVDEYMPIRMHDDTRYFRTQCRSSSDSEQGRIMTDFASTLNLQETCSSRPDGQCLEMHMTIICG